MQIWEGLRKAEQGSSAAYLYVVGMSSETKDPKFSVANLWKQELKHYVVR